MSITDHVAQRVGDGDQQVGDGGMIAVTAHLFAVGTPDFFQPAAIGVVRVGETHPLAIPVILNLGGSAPTVPRDFRLISAPTANEAHPLQSTDDVVILPGSRILAEISKIDVASA